MGFSLKLKQPIKDSIESLEGVIPNFLGFPQPIPTWPRRTLQLFFETFEVADVTPLGFVCLDNQ